MLTDICPVQWAGPQAVVTLPEHIGAYNAGQIREELLSVINRGATTVIADMTTTISCDHEGTDAVVRACQRAVNGGAELRLVVAQAARRMFGLGGLDGVVTIYPSLEAAVAARPPDGNGAGIPPAEQAHRSLELFDNVVSSLFHIGLSLHVAMDLPADAASERIAAAVLLLDETIREVRDAAFTARGHETAPRTSPRNDTVQELPLPERGGEPGQKGSHKWWVLAVLCISVLLVAIDNTIVNVALPTLNRRINASTADLQWIVTAYSLLFAGLLLVAGYLGDRMGRKRILQIGLALFALTSLAAARSTSVDQLILARAGMGVAAAMIYPSTLALLSSTFTDRKQKAAAIGIWSGVSGLAVGLGPLAGGLLLEHYWWGSIFMVNIPVVVVALIAGFRLVPESRDPAPGRFDLAGALLSVASIGLLVWAVIEAPVRGWTDVITVLAFAGVIVLLATFIFWESRRQNPLLDVRFFRNPRFSAAAAAISMAFFGLFGFIFVITMYFQLIRGYSTLHAGAATLPFALVMGGLSPVAILIMKKVGTKLVVTAGLLLMSAGFIVAARAPLEASYWRIIVVAMVLMAAGLALSTGPATDAILGSLPAAKVGVGSAVNDTTREVGGVLGVAITGSVMSWYYGNRLGTAWSALGIPHAAVQIGKGSVGAGLAIAQKVPTAQASAVTLAVKNSFISGMHAGSFTVAAVTFAGAIAAWLFLPGRDLVLGAGPRVADGGAGSREAERADVR